MRANILHGYLSLPCLLALHRKKTMTGGTRIRWTLTIGDVGILDTISSQKQQQQHPQSNDSVKMIAKELSFIVCHVLKTMVACRYHHHGGTCDFVIRTDQGTFEPIFVRHDPYFTPCLPTLVRPFPRVLNVGSKFVFGSSVHPNNPLINCQTGEKQIDFVCPICSHATSFVKCFCHVNSCEWKKE